MVGKIGGNIYIFFQFQKDYSQATTSKQPPHQANSDWEVTCGLQNSERYSFANRLDVVVAYEWLLASTLTGKTDFGTFGELLANKSLSLELELDKN